MTFTFNLANSDIEFVFPFFLILHPTRSLKYLSSTVECNDDGLSYNLMIYFLYALCDNRKLNVWI